MTWWVWILLGLVLLLIEVAVPGGIILLFFGVAAMVVGVLVGAGAGGPVWLQWLSFSVLSVVSLLALRGPILRRLEKSAGPDEKVDTLVGEPVLVILDMAPGAEGKAELRGTSWTAHNLGDRLLSRGETCIVERVQGLKLFVRAR